MPNDLTTLQNLTLCPEAIPDGFSPAQTLAMAALLAGRTKTAAAKAAGVTRVTVHAWLSSDPEFMAFYASANREMVENIQVNLRLLSGKALVSIRRLLTRGSVSDQVKLAAAMFVVKVATTPIEGPADAEEAANEIRKATNRNHHASMLSKIGFAGADLYQPIGKDDVAEDEEDDDD